MVETILIEDDDLTRINTISIILKDFAKKKWHYNPEEVDIICDHCHTKVNL